MIFRPQTKLGAWSVWLTIGLIGVFAFMNLLVALGQRGGATFFSNPYLAICGIIGGGSGIAAFFVGITAIIKQQERSLLTYIATTVGLLLIIFIVGDII